MAVSLGNSGDSQGLAEGWTKGDSRGRIPVPPCDLGTGHFPRSGPYSTFIRAGALSPRHTQAPGSSPPWERARRTHHTHTHTHTRTHRAGYAGHWPGNTYARPPSDVNKPRTHCSRAPVQGLFSPSHVRAHTAPGPAWADADARRPALPLPAPLGRLPARSPRRGPSPPHPAKLAWAPSRSSRTSGPRPHPHPQAVRAKDTPKRRRSGAPAAPPRARSRARRPCRLGFRAPVPVSDPRPSPAAASPGAPCTRGCRCRPGVAVSARALLLSDPPPVPTAGRSEPGSRERSAEFCCGAGGAGGGAEL